ncbi:MmcQ/YjbR family DNA-binding protein [Enterococcus asini]|uniref:MmcQ/YjbR family DNA-binding protein n=1 Tax=Enterococcus asini TaxID=57732 RepID=UPI00266B7C16|nr:MmcQ/YjbR family DNA-binding protein [Enterococcus asini]
MEKSMIAQRITTSKAFGETFKGAKVYFRDDWEVFYFDLQGKMFGMMSDQAGEDAIITLKNLPEKNEELRELYQGIVIPGYYANKTYWNSIKLASPEVSDEAIKQMITISYQLVYQKLTKKQKAEIDGE